MTTPFGRYRWKRLPFGLKVSSEIFQKRLLQALVLLQKRCKDKNIKLNDKKSDIEKSSISFMGHTISDKRISPDPKKVNPLLCHNANFGHICPKFANYDSSIDI